MKCSHAVAVCVLSSTMSTSPHSAFAAPDWTCLEPAAQAELSEHFWLSDQIVELIAMQRPELKDVALLNAAMQKQNDERRHALREWVWNTDRSRLDTFNEFLNFSWTEEDRLAWIASDPDALSMQERLDSLGEEAAAHGDLTAYFAFTREPVHQTARTEIRNAFGHRVSAVYPYIIACF